MKVKRLTRSLLRYPGSKARLAPLIAATVSINGCTEHIFAEPLCGGASVSIALLEAGVVGKIAINDADPLVSSLWKCVFSDNVNMLADIIERIPVDLDQWARQKALVPSNILEAAVKCLFLNRTSFSGILNENAGPIGGRSQQRWKLGCRFNKEKIISRMLKISALSARVVCVENKPWEIFCSEIREKKVFFYFDPPFYKKADRLYRVAFNAAEHLHLHSFLLTCNKPWLLSYDNVSEVREIYSNSSFATRIIDNTYAAHPVGGNSYIGRELLFSNCVLPEPTHSSDQHRGLSFLKVESPSHQLIEKRKFRDLNML